MRRMRYGRYGRRGFGFGHLFSLLFLLRHPLLAAIVLLVVFAIAMSRRRR